MRNLERGHRRERSPDFPRIRVQRILPPLFRVRSDKGPGALAFNDLHNAVDAGEGDFFAPAAGPEDFEIVHFGGGAEAKVDARVGGGSVTGAADDVGALADAASAKENLGADSVARGFEDRGFRG